MMMMAKCDRCGQEYPDEAKEHGADMCQDCWEAVRMREQMS